MLRSSILILAALAAAAAMSGCASKPTAPSAGIVSLGAQLKKQDADLVGQQFRTILDFENAADAVFVQSATASPASGHTGNSSLHLNSTGIVRINSLLFGAKLPGDWTLLGAYVRPAASGMVNVSLVVDGQVLSRSARDIPAGSWAFAGIDLTDPTYAQPLSRAKSIELTITQPGGFDLDDVMLVNNRRTLVDWPGVWTIDRRGFDLNVNVSNQPSRRFVLAAADENGVEIEEISPLRLRLRDRFGKAITLLPDGRVLPTGQANDSSGQIDIAGTDGRLNRETLGDLDNDGYNEARGAYQISAAATRLSVRLTPGRSPVAWPLIEVRHLPPEADTVTANGKWIDKTARLPDGTLLILLPMTVDSPIEITIGVSGR